MTTNAEGPQMAQGEPWGQYVLVEFEKGFEI